MSSSQLLIYILNTLNPLKSSLFSLLSNEVSFILLCYIIGLHLLTHFNKFSTTFLKKRLKKIKKKQKELFFFVSICHVLRLSKAIPSIIVAQVINPTHIHTPDQSSIL